MIHPAIERLHQAAKELDQAVESRKTGMARLKDDRDMPAASKRAALTALVEQEYAALNTLLAAAYDDQVLDWVCKGAVA